MGSLRKACLTVLVTVCAFLAACSDGVSTGGGEPDAGPEGRDGRTGAEDAASVGDRGQDHPDPSLDAGEPSDSSDLSDLSDTSDPSDAFVDTGDVDGGVAGDGGTADAGELDAGEPDASEPDTGTVEDGGASDADPRDAGPWDAGVARCEQGGQEAGSSGTEAPFGEAVVGLCRMAIGCDAIWQIHPPPEDYRYKGTPNHKLLWRVWYYGWAQMAGTPDQKNDARDFLAAFFDAQLEFGHQAIAEGANEVLNTSHYQIWTNGKTCARLLAFRHNDPALLSATGRWWRGEKTLYDALQRDRSIDAPGARFKEGQAGPSQLRDVIYSMIMDWPLSGNPGKPDSAWWDQYYNVSAWTLREILRLGDDLGGAKNAGPGDLPKLSDPLYLNTKGDDFVFVFPRLTGALEPLFWVARIGGQATYAPYMNGTPGDNPNPPPDLPGASVQVIQGR